MPPAVLMSSMERSCLFSAPSTWSWVTCWRSASRSFLSSRRPPLPPRVEPNQPKRSRTGLTTRLAPSWIGASTSIAPRCTLCRAAELDSPQEAVSRVSESATRTAKTARRRRTALSYMRKVSPKSWSFSSPGPPVARVVAVRAVDRLELLQRAARAHRDAGQRRLRAMGGHLRLLAQSLIHALQQRSAAGEHDAAIHDVRRQLGGSPVQRLLDGVDDLRERLFQCGTHLLGGEDDGLGQAGHEVAAADLRLHLLL